MRSKKIGRINALNGGDSFYSKTGQALGFYVVAKGTNKTGQVGAAGDVGRFLLKRNGRELVNVDFADMQKIMNIRSGAGLLDSTDGGAFVASTFIPMFEEGFVSCLSITDDKELEIEYQPANSVGTVFDALDVSFRMREAAYPEKREFYIRSKAGNYGAAADSDPINLGNENVTSIFVNDESDVLTSLQVDQDGRTVLGNSDPDDLRAETVQEGRIEDKTFDFPRLVLASPGNQDTLRSRSTTVINTVSGAGNINYIFCGVNVSGRGNN